MNKKTVKGVLLRITKGAHLLVSTALFCACFGVFYWDLFNQGERIIYLVAGGAAFLALVLLLGRV